MVAAVASPALPDCRTPYWKSASVLQRTAEHVLTADFDEDGKVDVAANTATTLFIAKNNGNGGLAAAVDVYTGTILGSAVAAELTGDSHVDLLFASGNSLVVLPGNGNGTFAPAITSLTTIAPNAISVARFDPDLDSDVAVFDPALAVLVIFTNDGAGTFTERTRLPLRPEARAFVTGDFDGDSLTDVVVGYAVVQLDAFYGRSDDAFDAVTILGAGSITGMRASDMNSDGWLDLTSVRSPSDSVAVLRNLGSRSFGDPLSYFTPSSTRDHVLDDLSGDGAPDVVATGQGCAIWTLTGTGLGTLFPYRVTGIDESLFCGPMAGGDVATGDFDGDGRRDVVVSSVTQEEWNGAPLVAVLRNLCGDGRIIATALAPLISAGQSASIRTNILAPLGTESPITATGSVSIREGATTLATGTLSNGGVTISVSGLSLGVHSLVAVYGGDVQYEPLKAPVTITVTNETTTTTLEVDPPVGVFGTQAVVKATVTSSTAGTPTGPLTLMVEEWFNSSVGSAPTATMYGPWEVGTWTFTARFDGDATHPPSSATMTYVIHKATPTISVSQDSSPAGVPSSISVTVTRPGPGTSPTGTVTLGEGDVTFGTYPLGGLMPLPTLAVGLHFLHITYNGDANYNSTAIYLPYLIFPAGQQSIDARGTAGAVRVTWFTEQRILRRKTVDETWAQASFGSCCPEPPFMDTNALPETVYLYRMEGHDGSVSHADLGMRIGFTEDPLIPGTRIKAAHLQEIIRAANIVRSAAHLSAVSLTATVGGNVITAAQLNALRNAINEARVSVGALPFTFTGSIAPQTPIQAIHMQELREAVR
jgi:Bacterial Ig-like domain (group 3)/FG-GAP-like repeat